MTPDSIWLSAEVIDATSVVLDPLRVDDAADVAKALDDPDLHRFIGGEPAPVDELRTRFASLVAGQSPDGSQGWLNWVVRDKTSLHVIGTVQATLSRRSEGLVADIAWVVATAWQGQGKAKEAAAALVEWLWARDAHAVVAYVHPENAASAAVARSLGLNPTDGVVDGEVRWVRKSTGAGH